MSDEKSAGSGDEQETTDLWTRATGSSDDAAVPGSAAESAWPSWVPGAQQASAPSESSLQSPGSFPTQPVPPPPGPTLMGTPFGPGSGISPGSVPPPPPPYPQTYPQAQYPQPPYPQASPQQSPYPYAWTPGSAPSAQTFTGAAPYPTSQPTPYPQPYPAPPQPPMPQPPTPPSGGPEQPRSHRGRTIGIVAAVLVAAVGLGFGIRYARSGDSATNAGAGATASGKSGFSASAGTSGNSATTNDGTTKPSAALVRQLYGDDSLNVSWVSLTTSGQTAVAFASDFTLDGRSATDEGGHLVMTSRGGQWQKLPNAVITTQSECSALMQLGSKEAVDASAVMNQKFCDPEVVYRLVSTAELNTAGLGALHITKAVDELSTTQLLPSDLSGSCTRSTPPYSSYSGFVPDIWTKDGTVQAFTVEGGSNRTRSGAGIGTSLARLTQIYGTKLTDVTSAYPYEAVEKALAISADGSEMDFLVSGGDVTKIIVRNSSFSTSQC